MRQCAVMAVIASVAISTPAFAEEVPSNLVGHWAIDGGCDDPEKSIHIEADTLAFGAEEGEAVEFFTNDSPAGNGAIHWSEEGSVDNFEFDVTDDVLLYNSEGYGMGATPEVYRRCAD